MKLIDGHEVIEHAEVNGEDREFIRILMDYIEDADEVEPKQGEWIYPADIIGFGRCSNCKALWDKSLIDNIYFKYCPRCGARIKGADDDN